MTEKVELKNCPFCGGKAAFTRERNAIGCTSCWAEGPVTTPEGIAHEWNRRADEQSGGWQAIDSAPVDQQVVFGYFGPDKQWHGFCAVVKQFQWEKMDKPLATGWPAHTVEPTHWMPLTPPGAEATPLLEP